MDTQSSLSFANRDGLNIKKFPLMSRGFEGRGLNLKWLDGEDFPNLIQPVAGDGDAAVDRRIYFKVAILEMVLCGSQQESYNFMDVLIYLISIFFLTYIPKFSIILSKKNRFLSNHAQHI
jgi:hypothetical protein